jgi:hypothetical protein
MIGIGCVAAWSVGSAPGERNTAPIARYSSVRTMSQDSRRCLILPTWPMPASALLARRSTIGCIISCWLTRPGSMLLSRCLARRVPLRLPLAGYGGSRYHAAHQHDGPASLGRRRRKVAGAWGGGAARDQRLGHSGMTSNNTNGSNIMIGVASGQDADASPQGTPTSAVRTGGRLPNGRPPAAVVSAIWWSIRLAPWRSADAGGNPSADREG